MFSKGKINSSRFLIILGLLLIIGLSACTPQGTQGTETPGVADGQEDRDSDFDSQIQPPTCPTEDTRYILWISHYAVLDIDAGDGVTFYLKWENEPVSYFQAVVGPLGIITNEGLNFPQKIRYQGTLTHPNDEDCPVQTFEGIWDLRAEITGLCLEGIVYLDIKEEWIDPVLHSDCGDPIGSGPGIVSAPELELEFDLSKDWPTDGIKNPEGGVVHVDYFYYLVPAGEELPLVPLVPFPGQ